MRDSVTLVDGMENVKVLLQYLSLSTACSKGGRL